MEQDNYPWKMNTERGYAKWPASSMQKCLCFKKKVVSFSHSPFIYTANYFKNDILSLGYLQV